ncbi:MAG: porin [Pirellulaceae bacterium]|nr:porin [Planctomycetales bacterium]
MCRIRLDLRLFLYILAAAGHAAAEDVVDVGQLQQQLDALSKQVEQLQQHNTAPPATTETLTDAWCAPPVEKPQGDKPTYPIIKMTGFFHADAGWFGQDALNMLTPVDGTPIGDIQDGADFRRARLAAVGDLTENTGYMLEMDFAFPGRPSFMDVWAEVKDTFALGNFRVGQWRQPFSMDAMTSVRELPMLERALPFAFVPFRQIGAGFYGNNEAADLTWAYSVFRFPTDTFGGNVGDNGGFGLATRWTWVPLTSHNDHRLLHMGVNYSFGDPANDVVRYRNQPEFFVSETGGADLVPAAVPANVPLFVDTGIIPTQNFNLYGAEVAGVLGSFWHQSEVIFSHINRTGGGDNFFWGAYSQIGYYLTGEVRPYNHKGGVLTRVTPLDPVGKCHGLGAWEVVGRWSYIDLNDATVAGNELTNLSAGLNWHLNRNLKWQFQYIHGFLDNIAVGQSNANIYAMRVQMDF